MFYVNKKDKTDVKELIYSDSNMIIVLDQNETLEKRTSVGRLQRTTKKEFKKTYKKANKSVIKVEPVDDTQKNAILEEIVTDKYGLLNHTEEYIERKKVLDRQEYFEAMSDEEYKESLKELAD